MNKIYPTTTNIEDADYLTCENRTWDSIEKNIWIALMDCENIDFRIKNIVDDYMNKSFRNFANIDIFTIKYEF